MKLFNIGILLSFLLYSLAANANKIEVQGFEYELATPENWVEVEDITKIKKPSTDMDANWLLSDTQVSMTKQKYSRYKHYAVFVNSESGTKVASEFSIYFLPSFQSLKIHAIRLHRDGKISDLTKIVDIRLLQQEENFTSGIYDGGVTARLLVKDVRVGDTVEYSYTVSGRNPIYKNNYFANFSLNWTVPVAKVMGRLITDKALYHSIKGVDKNVLKTTKLNKQWLYSWTMNNIEGVYDEGDYPNWYNPYSELRFTQFKSWKGVIDWATEIYKLSTIENKELIALSDKWAKETDSKKAYAEKVIRYAQNNIRYFGIEIGQNSHKPYSPEIVFQRKFGDCKDKTMFINNLLARQGIDAYPALVSSRSTKAIEDILPYPGAFDHVISTFNIDGKNYWIDGTRDLQFGQLDSIDVTNFESVLIIKPGSKGLSKMDKNDKVASVKLNETYTSSGYEKPVTLLVEYEYSYSQAEKVRRFYQSEGKQAFVKYYQNIFTQQHPSLTLDEKSVINDDQDANVFKFSLNFKIKDYWESVDGSYTVNLYGDLIHPYVQKPRVVARTMPLFNYYPIKLDHFIQLKYPKEVDWSLPDLNLAIETDALAYTRKIDIEKKSISIHHSYISKMDHVPVDSIPEYMKKTKRITDAIYYSVSINETSDVKTDSIQSLLRNLLKKNRDNPK